MIFLLQACIKSKDAMMILCRYLKGYKMLGE
jgi:hypothetical protein